MNNQQALLKESNASQLLNNCLDLTQPNWPMNRGLERYKELTGFHPERIRENGIWIDIGPGANALALSQLKRDDILKVGISGHQVDAPSDIHIAYGFFPEVDLEHLNIQKVDLITDIYSAFSYSDYPLRVLMAQLSMLKKGGELFIFSEKYKINDFVTWYKLADILAPLMGVDLSFKVKEVFADANQVKEDALLITGKKIFDTKVTPQRLLEIIYSSIGVPKIEETIWQAPGSNFQINSISYS